MGWCGGSVIRKRVKAATHEAVIRHLFRPALEADAATNFENVNRVNIAHTDLLAHSGSKALEHAVALLTLYRRMLREGPGCLELDPTFEDLRFNVERYVIQQLGVEGRGRMHTGRSWNDLNSTTFRMRVWDAVLRLVERAILLRKTLLDVADAHAEVVMPGYTHLQPAQPITFGYHLSAIADAFERDTQRLQRVYGSTNLSALTMVC